MGYTVFWFHCNTYSKQYYNSQSKKIDKVVYVSDIGNTQIHTEYQYTINSELNVKIGLFGTDLR